MTEQSTGRDLQRRLTREQSSSRLPSLSAGIVRDGALVWAGSAGTVDGRASGTAAAPDTQYRIGSITKTFVAVQVLRLRDAGRLDLDDPLDDHVPGTALGRATIASLLSHSSGVQAETDGPWWERTEGMAWDELAGSLSRSSLRHRPGRRHHYSNVGFAVLGELVARRSGRGWFDSLRAELLEPLGMYRTTARPVAPHAQGLAVHPFADVVLPEPEHDAAAMAPAGQLWSTVEDLARWAAFLGGDTAGLLDVSTLTEMSAPIVVNDVPGEAWTSAQGLGLQLWNVDGRRFVGHGGSMPGFLALLRIDRDTGDAVVAAANSTTGLSSTFAPDLLTAFADAEPHPPATWHPSEVTAEVLELVGPWYWGPLPMELRARPDGWLTLGPAGDTGRTSRFRPEGPATWVGLDGYYAGEPLRVVRRPEGSVSHLDLASFCLTRTPYDPTAEVPGGVDPRGWR